MKDNIDESIALLDEYLDEKVSSPEKNLQNISEGSPILDKQESETLRSMVAKLL